MRLIAIISVAILLIAGGTIGALKYFKIGPFAPVEEKDNPKKPIVVDPNQVVEIPLAFKVPVYLEDQVTGTLGFKVKLNTVGRENAVKIKLILPRIIDAFFRDLHVFIPILLQKYRSLDIPVLNKRLLNSW